MVKVISRSAAAAGPLVRSTVATTPTEPASRSRRDSALAVVLVMIFFTAAAASFSDPVFIVVPCSLSIWPTHSLTLTAERQRQTNNRKVRSNRAPERPPSVHRELSVADYVPTV